MSLILFVCSGNVCRSPMAAGLMLRKLTSERLETHHKVMSAGIWALDGNPASENARAVMAERGIDISDHIAHTVTANDVAEADLILVMSQEHAEVLRNTWPQYDWKLHRLAEMSGRRKDISDPYGRAVNAYRDCADTISDYIDRGFARILALI
jgi:protein-tyrosine-phosphatase